MYQKHAVNFDSAISLKKSFALGEEPDGQWSL